ncbi:MAG: bifunctional 5,10-methylenetetrahydrofolate dehydrogenase/5,10-methenyltetrahydrofolate cyclohydrolase [Patescibacteria group bacterium]
MVQILDGKAIAERIREKVKAMVASLSSQPGMAAILVGDDPASHLYVSLKERACAEVGIRFHKFLFAAGVSQAVLINKVQELNDNPEINGILVQLPLPTQDPDAVIAAINPNKDIDGFHQESLRRLEAGQPGLVSPVALGIMKLIDMVQGEKRTAVLVCSELFGRPIRRLLNEQHIDVIENTKDADIVIVALGKPRSFMGDQLKPGAIVIDVGTTKTPEGLMGDVDFASAEQVVSAITPVPGGVGPTTVAMLTLNVVKAYHLQH